MIASHAVEGFAVVIAGKRDHPEVAGLESYCGEHIVIENGGDRASERGDVSIVIGDRCSANANKLYDVLVEAGGEVYFIEDIEGLRALAIDLASKRCALVVASASTPGFVEERIIAYLQAIGIGVQY